MQGLRRFPQYPEQRGLIGDNGNDRKKKMKLFSTVDHTWLIGAFKLLLTDGVNIAFSATCGFTTFMDWCC